MVIQHNLYALNANRMLGNTTGLRAKKTEKLSSGYRINRSADDAAGLAISEKMRRQIRGLTQASANAQDGISLVQSAEGALNEVHDMIHRCNELAVKGANGTLSDEDRGLIDQEIQQLKDAIDGVANNVTFNEIRLFPEDGYSPKDLQKVGSKHYDIRLNLEDGNVAVQESADPAGSSAPVGVTPGSAGSVLADKIANELIPNAVSQILDTFPSLKTAVGSSSIDLALDISYIDGPSNTLAYAQFSYYSDGRAVNFLVKVDSSDFTDDDALGTGSRAEMLESTLAHELTHTVMQYTMTKPMVGLGVEALPGWFKEGTAQLSGGGFTTGWNDTLHYYANGLTDASDDSKDEAIANYLKRYSVSGRPYGHGYLASAYIGYLANGGTGDVTAQAIANGMDRVFADILSGTSFSDAIQNATGYTPSEIENLFANADADSPVTAFVRQLSYNSRNGAGSVVAAGGLNAGGTNILGNSAPANQPFQVDPGNISVDMESGAKTLELQVGSEAGQSISISLFQMDSNALGLKDVSAGTVTGCKDAIEKCKDAIKYVSNVRSYYGAVQNRLEHTIRNLDNVIENTTAAESQIRDADMAQEMLEFSNYNILMQVGQSMLAQANQQTQSVMNLLQ